VELLPSKYDYNTFVVELSKSDNLRSAADREMPSDIGSITVLTPQAQAVLRGDAELVLGQKGTGKTYLYNLMTEGTASSLDKSPFPSDVLVVDLTKELEILEYNIDQLVSDSPNMADVAAIWRLLIASEIFSTCIANGVCPELHPKFQAFLDRYFTKKMLIREDAGLARSRLKFLSSGTVEGLSGSRPEVSQLIQALDTQLSSNSGSKFKRIWACIDRLDELDGGPWVIEGTSPQYAAKAQTALIAGVVNVLGKGVFARTNLSLKVFIRQDIFDQINLFRDLIPGISTPDIDKIQSETLTWTHDQLLVLLDRIIGSAPGAKEMKIRFKSREEDTTVYPARGGRGFRSRDILFGPPPPDPSQLELAKVLIYGCRSGRNDAADDAPPRRVIAVLASLVKEQARQYAEILDNPNSASNREYTDEIPNDIRKKHIEEALDRERKSFLQTLVAENRLYAEGIRQAMMLLKMEPNWRMETNELDKKVKAACSEAPLEQSVVALSSIGLLRSASIPSKQNPHKVPHTEVAPAFRSPILG
jgi:hypothetical protein